MGRPMWEAGAGATSMESKRRTARRRGAARDLEQQVAELTRALAEAQEQPTATSAILRVINSSPTDPQPVLDTVVERAVQLCGADNAAVLRREGDVLRSVAAYGPSGSVGVTLPISRGSVSGRHLLSLINDILDLSNVEAGRMELEPNSFSLRQALEISLALFRERAGRLGISLSLDVDPDLDVIEADERKVKQVLFNLLPNAVKFTPDGGRVEITARLAGDEAQVAVRDTGIGIAAEDQARIFEEFQQAGYGSLKRQEGTGLGLTLTKKFVELHGGRIQVESAAGAGSTFIVDLPIRQAVPAAREPATADSAHE